MKNKTEFRVFAYAKEQGVSGETKKLKKTDRASDVLINRMLILLLFVVMAIIAFMIIRQAAFIRNGKINILESNYAPIKTESSQKADVTLALNSSQPDEKIDIEVPDYCPVNYKAYAPIAMVYDKTDGAVLYSKNETEKCYPASTAKLMTAAVALDAAPDDFQFVAGNELSLVPENSPTARISKCFSFDRQELTNGIITKGASDISYVAAASIGSLLCDGNDVSPEEAVAEFVDLMNRTANRIGCTNTHFSNPDGYFDEDMYTTAIDMMKIAVYATDHKEITSAGANEHVSGKLKSGQTYEWVNTNELINPESSFYCKEATGLKTGMTTNSGYCIVASANSLGHELICVIMNDETDEYRYLDAKNLFEISFSYIEEFANAETGEY